ncbi:hypothetical protein GBAR_LOCUS18716 [Geodia barretti]|uniref:Uncharacterized protein n=1 Tax=Geodia barretti TaxID=519541 RepID=A0AA35SQ50_GEOBA|nr:hypothetical protein GBAR_LOCUS18716 [Geodia barretti]
MLYSAQLYCCILQRKQETRMTMSLPALPGAIIIVQLNMNAAHMVSVRDIII